MNDARVMECEVSTKQKWLVFFAMCLAICIVAFSTTATTNAMIPIRIQMNLNPSQLQWTSNAYVLAALMFMILGGLLSDRFGRRNMNGVGTIIFIVGAVVCSMSEHTLPFILGRFIQGVGVAIIMPGTLALMKVTFPSDQQGIVSTGWAFAVGLGMGFGPFLSGIFCQTIGWQYVFKFVALMMFLSLVLLLIGSHKHSPGNKKVTIDFIGFLIFIFGFGFFIYDVIEAAALGWRNPVTISLLIIGMLFMASQPWVERHVHKIPFINFAYFRRPRFMLGCIGMFICGYMIISILFFGNLYLQNPLLLNYSAYQAGFAVIPLGIGLTLSVLIVEKLYDKIGIGACIQLLLFILLIGAIWFVCLNAHMRYALVWEPFFIIGVGCGMAMKAFPAMAIEALSPEEAARSSSVVSSCVYVGVIIATSIGTILSTRLGRLEFLELTNNLNLSVLSKLHLADLVVAHPNSVHGVLLLYPEPMRYFLFSTAQLTALKSVQYAMLSCLVFLGLAMIATNILLKMKEYVPSEDE